MLNIGIVGLGNVGRGVLAAIRKMPDLTAEIVWTRRPEQVEKELKKQSIFALVQDSKDFSLPKGMNVDVAILCGGSKEDTLIQGPEFARHFNTVDSFDTHKKIPDYFAKMDIAAKENNNVSVISAGWDPGIFSLMRLLGEAFLPRSENYTFWGRGISQGHSNAARKVEGVKDARQYTIPIEEAVQQVRSGETPKFSTREMHKRLVYVVSEEGADEKKIVEAIVTMPDYFDEYDTEVVFITKEQMEREHASFPHGGFVFTTGTTGEDDKNRQILEYRCTLMDNPEFTSSVLIACARAAYRLKEKGKSGAVTMLDIPPALYSPHSVKDVQRRFFM